MADSTNDSDSDLEYSDCLEAAELGNDLKVDELADVKNDEKSCNKNDSNEKFFDIHSSLGDEKAEADDEDEVDPLKMRQEEEDKLTEEEKEVHLCYSQTSSQASHWIRGNYLFKTDGIVWWESNNVVLVRSAI